MVLTKHSPKGVIWCSEHQSLPINTTEAIMSCSHHCNQGRNCNGSCRQARQEREDALGYALLYAGWAVMFGLISWVVWS